MSTQKLKEMRDDFSRIFGMMAGSTDPSSGRMVIAEAEMLRLLNFVQQVPDLIDLLEAAERERDAASSEPVGTVIYSPLTGFTVEWSDCHLSPGQQLYTAAQPAVLPPAISTEGLDPESRDIDDVRNLAHIEGANWMRQQCLELGAQQQKVVELPKPHAHLIWIQAGRSPDDYWDDVEVSRSEEDRCCDGSSRYAVYSEFEVKAMLDAANVKWEVKK